MIALVRVDNRLVHGQVVQAWLPYLSAQRIVVVDDEAANSPLVRAAMELCVPPEVRVDVTSLDALDPSSLGDGSKSGEKVLVLLRDVGDAVRLREKGLSLRSLNLGNVHFASGREQVSPSVYLSPDEVAALRKLAAGGVDVEVRALPRDRPLTLKEIEGKVAAAN